MKIVIKEIKGNQALCHFSDSGMTIWLDKAMLKQYGIVLKK